MFDVRRIYDDIIKYENDKNVKFEDIFKIDVFLIHDLINEPDKFT